MVYNIKGKRLAFPYFGALVERKEKFMSLMHYHMKLAGLDRAPEYDYLISAEAKGIPLVHEMARLAGNQKYFLARKAPKLYMTGVFEAEVRSITTEKDQKLYLDMADAELMRGKRILIVDDVISTGESLHAVEHLVEKAGGIICGKMTVLAEGDAQERKDLIYLEKLPLFDKNGRPIA